MAKPKIDPNQDNFDLAQTILTQWLAYRSFYFLAISDDEITDEDEREFLDTTSAIAQNVRKLGQKIDPKKSPFKNKEVAELLKKTVNIDYFRRLPEADRRLFYRDWHHCKIYLTRTVGELKFRTEGYVPQAPRRKKKASNPLVEYKVPIMVAAAVAIVVGVAVFLLDLI